MADYMVTNAGAGSKNGSDWDNAMGIAEFETAVEGGPAAGSSFFLRGSFTLGSDIDASAINGTFTSPINVIGVKSGTSAVSPTFADWSFGNDRGLVDCGVYLFNFGDYWIVRNLLMIGVAINIIQIELGSIVENLLVSNVSAVDNSGGINAKGSYSKVLHCEVSVSSSVNGVGISMNAFDGFVAYNYVHLCDSGGAKGIHADSDGGRVIGNILSKNVTGIAIGSSNNFISHNTIYDCLFGVTSGVSFRHAIINNIFADCTTEASFTTEYKSNYFDYNCWGQAMPTLSNVTAGNHAVLADPLLIDPANEDFRLKSGSPCINAGARLTVNEGIEESLRYSIGADQVLHNSVGRGFNRGMA